MRPKSELKLKIDVNNHDHDVQWIVGLTSHESITYTPSFMHESILFLQRFIRHVVMLNKWSIITMSLHWNASYAILQMWWVIMSKTYISDDWITSSITKCLWFCLWLRCLKLDCIVNVDIHCLRCCRWKRATVPLIAVPEIGSIASHTLLPDYQSDQ